MPPRIYQTADAATPLLASLRRQAHVSRCRLGFSVVLLDAAAARVRSYSTGSRAGRAQREAAAQWCSTGRNLIIMARRNGLAGLAGRPRDQQRHAGTCGGIGRMPWDPVHLREIFGGDHSCYCKYVAAQRGRIQAPSGSSRLILRRARALRRSRGRWVPDRRCPESEVPAEFCCSWGPVRS